MIESQISKKNRLNQLLITISLVSAFLAAISSGVKSFYAEKWVENKKSVAVSPNQIELPYPFTYYESVAHPVNEDSNIKNFAFKYVKLTKDLSTIANYQSTSTDIRYMDKLKFSDNLRTALEMTSPGSLEYKSIAEEYANSNVTYRQLTENNVGYKFNIDGVMVYGAPEMGGYRVVVMGEYEAIFDSQKTDIPAKYLGYKYIELIIVRGQPTKDPQTNSYLNKYGYFVVISMEKTIDRSIKEYLEQEYSERQLDK